MSDEKFEFTFDELDDKARASAVEALVIGDWDVAHEELRSVEEMMGRIGVKYDTYSYDGLDWRMWVKGGVSWCEWDLPDEPSTVMSDGYWVGEGMAQEFNRHVPMLRALWGELSETEYGTTRWDLASGAYESEYLKAADAALQSGCRDVTAECWDHTTEEYWREMAEANEWLFTEDGQLI